MFEEINKYEYEKIIIGIEKDNITSRDLFLKEGFIYANKTWDELAFGFPEGYMGYIYENNGRKM